MMTDPDDSVRNGPRGASPRRARRLRLTPRFREPAVRWGKVFALSAAVGLLAGLAATALEFGLHHGVDYLIGRFTHLSGPGILDFNWGVLLLPAIGGLLVGLVVARLCPGDTPHGTNQLIGAFHQQGGNLSLRDPAIKAAASVGIISCGGSAGPEGPIAALGASIGSSLARRLSLSPRSRRTLLIAGCAGGVGAIFRCPLGGALFATSVLYREPEFEADSMVPAFISSVISYSTFMAFWGFGQPLIREANQLVFMSPVELIPYALLGPLCAIFACLLYHSIHFVEGRPLRGLHMPRWLSPALGGLLVGLIACALPQVMDARYRFVQHAVDGSLFASAAGSGRSWAVWAVLFGCVAVAKCVATSLTVGSARAGGLLGPSVFIGGVAGAFLGASCEAVYPGVFPEPLRKALIPVGMAGVLSASMGTPMAAIVMVTEMTGSYGLIVPLMLVATTAYVTGRRWGLNSAQVRSTAESPAHTGDTLVGLLQSYRVRDFTQTVWPYVVSPATTLREMVTAMPSGSRPVFAVVENGSVVGMVTVPDLSRPLCAPGLSDIIIAADIMSTSVTAVRPDQTLYEVLDAFRTSHENWLPVITRHESNRFSGMLSRQAIHQALRSHVETMRTHLHREHMGLAAIEQDEQLNQLLLGLAPAQTDAIHRMPVPSDAVGKSLKDAGFRGRYGVQVIAIQWPNGDLQCPANIDAPLRADDVLLVISGTPPPQART